MSIIHATNSATEARYVVTGTNILDRETGLIAKFQNSGVAQLGADWLNGPDATPEDYVWTASDQHADSTDSSTRPAWATATEHYEDTWMCHTTELAFRHYKIVLTNDIIEGGDMGTDILISWHNRDADSRDTHEHFTIRPDMIPGLIQALRRAAFTAETGRILGRPVPTTTAGRVLRRPVMTDDRLREVDGL